MNEKEFQLKHGFTDSEIETIKQACKVLNGKITNLSETLKPWQEWENVRYNQ